MNSKKIYFAQWGALHELVMLDSLMKESNYEIVSLLKLTKHFRRHNFRLKKYNLSNKWFIKLHIFFKLRHINDDDIFICTGSNIFEFVDLIKPLNCKKILVFRDSVDVVVNLQKNSGWLKSKQQYLDEAIPYFDFIFSFDKSDCKKYNFTYMKQFLPFTFEQFKNIRLELSEAKLKKNKKAFFIGQYRILRVDILNQLAPVMRELGYEINFNLSANEAEKECYDLESRNFNWASMSYLDNIKASMDADVIVEINFTEQSGPSLRAIEALVLNKKLITTNKNIIEYEFFSEDKIFILDNNYGKLPNFLNKKNKEIPIEELYIYSVDGFLDKLLKSCMVL